MTRVIARYGGFFALAIDALFWILVWIWNKKPELPLGASAGALYILYVLEFLALPLVALAVRAGIKRGQQTIRAGLVQVGLALVATGVSCWTIRARYVELP